MAASPAAVDIGALMRRLAELRPVFHSEADFQHAFAWEMHRVMPDAQVSLECKRSGLEPRARVDIWVRRSSGSCIAAELKYKKRPLREKTDGELYDLTNDGAQDLGRYDFLLDVWRVERVVATEPNTAGFAVLLTNDSSYWAGASGRATIDAAFRLHEGRCVGGLLAWGEGASAGTIKGREAALDLRGTYTCAWSDYSVVTGRPRGQFRYLPVYVPPVP